MKHTAAPWEVRNGSEVYGPRLSIGASRDIVGSFMVADCKGYAEEREANALLIARAPRMDAAIRAVLERLERDYTTKGLHMMGIQGEITLLKWVLE